MTISQREKLLITRAAKSATALLTSRKKVEEVEEDIL
jgi:hypothetical protein